MRRRLRQRRTGLNGADEVMRKEERGKRKEERGGDGVALSPLTSSFPSVPPFPPRPPCQDLCVDPAAERECQVQSETISYQHHPYTQNKRGLAKNEGGEGTGK
jgi:hypothetical protein